MQAKKIVAFGEVLLRFTPQDNKTISEATGFNCFYGGSEANVAIGLSALSNSVCYITVLPDNALGVAVKNNLEKYGVDTSKIISRGDVLGSYYLQTGIAGISKSVLYSRKGSEVSKATVDTEFDYDAIFKDCDLFHISGISFALSENCRDLCFKIIDEAKNRGIPVSFDFNYREKLWKIDEAAKVFKEIIPLADIVFLSTKDINAFLDKISPNELIRNNGCNYLIVRDRDESDSKHHIVDVRVYTKNGTEIQTTERLKNEFDVKDRVGSGDAFAAGMIHALLKNKDDVDSAIDFALGTFIMKHIVEGDFLAVSEDEVKDFIKTLENKDA